MSNKKLPAPNNLGRVKIILVDFTDSGVERTRIEINGHTFKRLYKKGHPIVWNDIYGTFNGCEAMLPEQEEQLEGIFQAYIHELINAKHEIDGN